MADPKHAASFGMREGAVVVLMSVYVGLAWWMSENSEEHSVEHAKLQAAIAAMGVRLDTINASQLALATHSGAIEAHMQEMIRAMEKKDMRYELLAGELKAGQQDLEARYFYSGNKYAQAINDVERVQQNVTTLFKMLTEHTALAVPHAVAEPSG